MTRLHTQHHRLYGASTAPGTDTASPPPLIGADGRVRALVLALAQPPDWSLLSGVWRGVQTDLGWPAPGIAVNGLDSLQLWFSLAEPVAPAVAAAVLAGLCRRYLPDVQARRLRRWPDADAGLPWPEIAPRQTGTERWSAFVAPDLAAVFADDPVLDMPPGDEAQADLLSRLASVRKDAWGAALAQLQPDVAAAPGSAPAPAAEPSPPTALAPAATGGFAEEGSLRGPYQDPSEFLRAVMNEARVPLAQRIDAAKALLAAASEAPSDGV